MTETVDNLFGVREIKEADLMTKAVDNKSLSTVLVIRFCFLNSPQQKSLPTALFIRFCFLTFIHPKSFGHNLLTKNFCRQFHSLDIVFIRSFTPKRLSTVLVIRLCFLNSPHQNFCPQF